MKQNIRRVINIIDIILLLSCMTIIFFFSSEDAVKSLETTNKVTTKAVETITDKDSSKKEDKKQIDNFIEENLKIIRKGAHFLEYTILGFLMINALKDYKKVGLKLVLISFAFSFLYACTDEIHQAFVPNRTALIGDVLVDSLGSFLGVFTFFLIYKIYLKFDKKQHI